MKFIRRAFVASTVAFCLVSIVHAQGTNGDDEESATPAGATAPEGVDTIWRQPLATRNQDPIALMFVHLTPEGARTIPRGDIALDVQLDYSNVVAFQDIETEYIRLDAEYLRTNVVLKRGFSHDIEAGISLPFYVYYGGFLDGFIDRFHRSLDLPNFIRGQTDYGLTRFELMTEDGVSFRRDGSFGAVGDLALRFKKTLFWRNRHALAARTVLKLPTGSPESLSGSGATDVGFGVAYDWIGDRWGAYGNLNYHVVGQPEAFTARNHWSFMLGGDFRFKPSLTALLQVDYLTRSVDSDLGRFGRGARQVALGLRWRHSDRFVYEWRFVEDLTDFSPDFTFAFQVGLRWAGGADEGSSP